MGGKNGGRNSMPDWAKEDLPPPCIFVKVYPFVQGRKKKKREYLGLIDLDPSIDLDFLEAAPPEELFNITPFPETQERWGGGHYEYPFWWRDEEGRKTPKRYRNGSIWGNPLSK